MWQVYNGNWTGSWIGRVQIWCRFRLVNFGRGTVLVRSPKIIWRLCSWYWPAWGTSRRHPEVFHRGPGYNCNRSSWLELSKTIACRRQPSKWRSIRTVENRQNRYHWEICYILFNAKCTYIVTSDINYLTAQGHGCQGYVTWQQVSVNMTPFLTQDTVPKGTNPLFIKKNCFNAFSLLLDFKIVCKSLYSSTSVWMENNVLRVALHCA